MKIWQRRGLGILALGGSAIGLGSCPAALASQAPGLVGNAVILLGAALFAWGLACGVWMLEGKPEAASRNAWFWLMQGPLVQTPVFGYMGFCGARLHLLVKLSPVEFGFAANVLGTQFGLNFGPPGQRIVFGVNVLALALAAFINRSAARAAPPVSATRVASP